MGLLFARMALVVADLSGAMDTIEEHILDGADTLTAKRFWKF